MKRHYAWVIVGLVTLGGSTLRAQQPTPAPAPPVPARAPGQPSPPRPAAPAPGGTFGGTVTVPLPAPDPSAGGQALNIRLDVSISDQIGTVNMPPKVLTLLLADRYSSALRSNFDDRYISMDARPTIVDGKIKLSLTMNCEGPRVSPFPAPVPGGEPPAAPRRTALPWSQTLTVIVENGKPLVVVENSDPANNRKMSVEVKATILK